jgi:hypothetical protein
MSFRRQVPNAAKGTCSKPLQIGPTAQESKENAFCGMWKDRDDLSDVDSYVRTLRKKRPS